MKNTLLKILAFMKRMLGALAAIFAGSALQKEQGMRKDDFRDPMMLSMQRPGGFIDFVGGRSSPIFIPRKHTIQSYRSQARAARKRRRAR
jgi:hypothetical protein